MLQSEATAGLLILPKTAAFDKAESELDLKQKHVD